MNSINGMSMETKNELLQQAIEAVDGCMCVTQVEPEDAAAWQVVRAALAKQADAAPVVADELPPLPTPLKNVDAWVPRDYGRIKGIEELEASGDYFSVDHMHEYASAALAQRVVSEAVPVLTGCLESRLYEAIGIARDRAQHAGSTTRIAKWDATKKDLKAALSTPPAAPVALSDAVFVGTISSGDIEGDEIGWDHELDHKIIDALPQLSRPNRHFGLFMAPLNAATQPTDVAMSDAKNCAACGAHDGERCRTRSDDQCDDGKHIVAATHHTDADKRDAEHAKKWREWHAMCRRVDAELPEGWLITYEMGPQMWGISLSDPDGNNVEFHTCDCESDAEMIICALDAAIAASAKGEDK